MATLVLGTMSAALGQTLGPIGSVLGQAIGSIGGSLLSPQPAAQSRTTIGPRLSAMSGVSSTEGAPVPRVFGRARVGGQMIWATRFFEQVNIKTTPVSGAGGGKASKPRATSTNVSYSYFANFAIGLCEGPIAFVRRIWADGRELDRTTVTMRFYRGDETQQPDPLIAAIEKSGSTPAYRGLAYVVFERFPLEAFGNRVPQMTFEVVRPVEGVGQMIRGVDLIPGATEFGYQPSLHTSFPGPGTAVQENRNQSWAATDWQASLDALQALCPNLKSVALVVSWFGDDLRAGVCKIMPRIDNSFKTLSYPFAPVVVADWWVAGLWRAVAPLVSQSDGGAAYGGTPADYNVTAAIGDLKARGLSVVFYPFVMMDISSDNSRINPWDGANAQPAYPWRGRITCHPAPGQPGSPNGTSVAATQVASFFGSANPAPSEWSYRRFILHYANLCKAAGGVDAFLVGSELSALTRVRASAGVYPAASALAALAVDVKAILGDTQISYAADWTEYGAHVLNGGAEVRFPLDVVWGSPAVSFVGIDAYWPVSDWRDGVHLDQREASSIYDVNYLSHRMAAGEAFDWYYASPEDRRTQTRTSIADGAYGKPWIFRQKDLVGWWSNAHFERVGGVELAGATAWVAQSKPIWLIEIGCPAVDRGPNAPNVFPDAKSSENAIPYFSRGFRDDLIQTRFIEAAIQRFDPAGVSFVDSWNPVSSRYSGRMVDSARIHFWAWDARPFPAFPELGALWSDAPNWETGHWLNGRLEGLPLDRLLTTLATQSLSSSIATPRPEALGFLDGYVLDRAMSARAAIEPLSDFYGFDTLFSSGALRFLPRMRSAALTLSLDDLTPDRDCVLVHFTRAQESELPHELAISFCDSENDYSVATVLSRRIAGASSRRAATEAAVMTHRASAQMLSDIWLEDIWVARETAEFQLRPTLAIIEAGDIVSLDMGSGARTWLITAISEGATRKVSARAVDASVYDRSPPPKTRRVKSAPRAPGPAFALTLDLAIAKGQPVITQYVAAYADPWPGSLAVYDTQGDAFQPVALIDAPATIGKTLNALHPGPVARFDRAASLDVKLYSGALASVGDILALGSAATMAICGVDGAWEIFSFSNAELIGQNTYRLTRLVRGLGAEEALAQRTTPAGANVVLLDGAVKPLTSGLPSIGLSRALRIGPANLNPGDPAYAPLSSIPSNKALLPLAPVQAKATSSAQGLIIQFIRRGRLDADAFEPMEIPLGEDSEAYRLSIAKPDGAFRILTVNAPNALYATADIMADFGAIPPFLDLTIQQISAQVGPGFLLITRVKIR